MGLRYRLRRIGRFATALRQRWPRRVSRMAIATCVCGAAAGCGAGAGAEQILFVGNSFTFGAVSRASHYEAGLVTDLNATRMGGVAGIFKVFANEAGLPFEVSIEAVGGKDLGFHYEQKRQLYIRPYDQVILQDQSTLDPQNPGDPAALTRNAGMLANLFHSLNPDVKIRLLATWPYPGEVSKPGSPWFGKSLAAMSADIERGYDDAKVHLPFIVAVTPVGAAFSRAVESGFADPGPQLGSGKAAPGKVSLWSPDNHHASVFGYYLYALMVFGDVTGRDPLSLGPEEKAARDLGIAPDQASTLQKIAHDELADVAIRRARDAAAPAR